MGRIMNWIRSVTTRMFGQQSDFFTKAGIPANAITTDMSNAIDQWSALYIGQAPWLVENRKSLGLPARIASEMATQVTLEMQMNVNDPASGKADANSPEKPKTRAAFLSQELQKVIDCIQKQTEYACAKGGLVFKPYPDNGGISFDYVQADDFYPCAYNSRGDITSAIFLSKKKVSDLFYTRVEKHTLTGKHYSVTNQCFKSMAETDVGEPCNLNEVPEWADIEDAEIDNVEFPLFAYFRIPLGNTIDPKSPLGVSVYARAFQSGLLCEADRQFQRLMWEYEGGELAIDASSDAFKTVGGRPELPSGKERLYRMNTLDPNTTSEELMKTFSPQLRDESYMNGLEAVKREIEDECGLARGTLSKAEEEAKTATEIKMTRQRTYATVTAIQKALETALRGLVKAADYIATLYGLAPEGEYDLQFVWDDSLVVDSEVERQRDLDEITAGIRNKWEYRMKWYGEDETTAKAMVVKEQNPDQIMGFGLPTKKPVDSEARNKNEENGGENA